MTELTMSNMKDRVGSELGVSDWMVVDQERINEFADAPAIVSGSMSMSSAPDGKVPSEGPSRMAISRCR